MTIRDRLLKLRSDFQALEPVIVDGFSMASPWLTAIFPAALTGWNTATRLIHTWPDFLRYPVSILAAAATESVGISAVHSLVKEWNRGKSASQKLLILAGIAELYYLAAIITVNVVVEAAAGEQWAGIVGRGILSTMSIVGALVIAVRAQSAEGDIAKQETTAKRNATRATQPAQFSQRRAIANERNPQGESQAEQHDSAKPAAIPPQEKPARGQSQAAARELRAEYPGRSNQEYAEALQINPAQVTRAFKESK